MKLSKKNILIVSPEPWDHIFVSKHHYAVHLGKRDNKVFFLGPPNGRETVLPTMYENVFVVNYKGFPPGLRYMPARIQRWLIRSTFSQIERLSEVQFDVIWSFDNSVFFDFSALPSHVLKISHIVDASQNFQTEKAAKTADICFCVTDQITSTLSRHNRRVYKVGHAFSPPVHLEKDKPEPAISTKMKAVYVGNLSIPYIDWLSILKLIQAHPEVQFVFVGPNGGDLSGDLEMRTAKRHVVSHPNVLLTGSIPFHELHRWYSAADILFLAYQEKYQHNQVTNAHKMMEYLGSGKMIVASFTLEYEELANRGLILMSEGNSMLCDNFTNASKNLSYWNSPQLTHARIDFAMAGTYEKRIQMIEAMLHESK